MVLASWKAVYQNAAYVLSAIDAQWVLQHIQNNGHSAYTTLRTFNKSYVYRLSEHFKRLEYSAKLMGIHSQYDEDALRLALHHILLDCVERADYLIRVYFMFDEPYGTIYVQIHELTTPTKQDYFNGVKCMTCTLQRNSPKAKLTRFMKMAEKIRDGFAGDIYEAIMKTEQGELLEGISSNFYVVKLSKVFTAEHGVLGGIVRGLILDVMDKEKIPYTLASVSDTQINDFEEAFITSSSRGVVPVTELDGIKIGNGKPGPVTKAIMDGYTEQLLREFETILPQSSD
ncbi:MAG: aminotransferase class IV family protein [Anaerolineaceae bacterium]|nr:aminotransferase class IV family protein [Anaerolineaceae bacterium]